MSLNTYLTFNDNCRQVFEFYRSVFGGEFDTILTFREGPPDMDIPEAECDRIMHVSLPIGSSVLMLTGVCKIEIIATNRPHRPWIPAYAGMTEWAR